MINSAEVFNLYYDDSVKLTDVPPRPSVPISLFLVFIFIITSLVVDKIVELTIVVKILGALLFFTFVIAKVKAGLIFPREIIFYWIFCAWSIMGLVNAEIYYLTFLRLLTLLQFSVMIFIIANYSSNIRCTNYLLWAVFLGCTAVAVSAYISGDYNASEYQEDTRVAGIAMNSNYFALLIVVATAVILYFIRSWKSLLLRAGLLVLLFVFVQLVVLSGSRKGFIALGLLLFLWFIKSFTRQVRENFKIFIVGVFLLAGIVIFLSFKLKGSTLAARFETAGGVLGGSNIDESFYSRFTMYKLGWDLFLNHPIVGIGLSQFMVKTLVAGYSHSNYMEILCSTGIVGTVIYYSIFVFFWKRLRRIKALPLEKNERELLNVVEAYLIIHLILDLVVVSYFEKRSWIILAVFIGWVCNVEQKYSSHYSYDENQSYEVCTHAN